MMIISLTNIQLYPYMFIGSNYTGEIAGLSRGIL